MSCGVLGASSFVLFRTVLTTPLKRPNPLKMGTPWEIEGTTFRAENVP